MLDLEVTKQLPGFSLQISLSCGDGLIAFFGPSGAGKTLTLNCIAGLVQPDAGRIAVNGLVVFDAGSGVNVPSQRRKVGYVFQEYALFPHLTVEENIGFGLKDVPREVKQARIVEMVKLTGLEGLERRRPNEISGGQRQRVAIARALAIGPSALLLDEPFTALDSGLRRRLQEEMLAILLPLKITTILVTHNLREAYILSDRIAVFDDGRVLQSGPIEEVVSRPRVSRVARLVGLDNIFSGTVREVTDGGLKIERNDYIFEAVSGGFAAGDAVELCIPSRDVVLLGLPAGHRIAPEPNVVHGVIVQRIPHLGSHVLLFKVDGWGDDSEYDLHVEVPNSVHNELGIEGQDRWSLYLKREALHVMPVEV